MIQLNTEVALKSLGNNQKLYKKVIDKFVAAYTQAADDLNSHIQKQELQDAERLAHTIKGLAGSLGAEELVHASAAVETALKNGVNAEEVSLLLGTFSSTLADTITACINTSNQMG